MEARQYGTPMKRSVGSPLIIVRYSMKTFRSTIAIIEVLLVFPAALFLSASSVLSSRPHRLAVCLFDWFAGLPRGIAIYLLLVALPLTAFVVGCATLLRSWRADAQFRNAALEIFITIRRHRELLLIAGATVLSGFILAIIAMHMMRRRPLAVSVA